MDTQKTHNVQEKGNAVALTLLGLAVAILAGVVVLYFVGKAKPQPIYQPQPAADSEEFIDDEGTANAREGWRTYENEEFAFSLEYPQGWVVSTGTLPSGDPVVSVFLVEQEETTNSVFGIQDNVSHVSVYPHGIAPEGIVGEKKLSTVIIEVPRATAYDYVLQTGRVWATIGVFDSTPVSWNEEGFLFARVRIEEEEVLYMRGESEITESEYNPQSSEDRTERIGFIDTNVREVEEEILKSFAFVEDSTTNEVSQEGDRVEVEHPEYREIISSPYTVTGKIFGTWYFEGDLSLRLETSDGEVLTEVPVALTKNTTTEEDYIPFEVSLVFETPTATSGQLILGRSGSFDLPAEASSNKVIPVVFDNE